MLLIGPRVSTLMCMRVDQLAVFLSAAASTAPTDDHENISRQDCDNDNDGVRWEVRHLPFSISVTTESINALLAYELTA